MFRMFKSFNSVEKAQMVDAGVKGMLLADAFLTVGALIYIVNDPSVLSNVSYSSICNHLFEFSAIGYASGTLVSINFTMMRRMLTALANMDDVPRNQFYPAAPQI